MPTYSRVENVTDVEPLFESSRRQPVLLFKHSLTCPISGRAFQEYESFLEARPEDDETVYTLVEIQKTRDVSAAIAERSGIKHESPQAILLRDGEVTWHASHWSIKADSLASAVDG